MSNFYQHQEYRNHWTETIKQKNKNQRASSPFATTSQRPAHKSRFSNNSVLSTPISNYSSKHRQRLLTALSTYLEQTLKVTAPSQNGSAQSQRKRPVKRPRLENGSESRHNNTQNTRTFIYTWTIDLRFWLNFSLNPTPVGDNNLQQLVKPIYRQQRRFASTTSTSKSKRFGLLDGGCSTTKLLLLLRLYQTTNQKTNHLSPLAHHQPQSFLQLSQPSRWTAKSSCDTVLQPMESLLAGVPKPINRKQKPQLFPSITYTLKLFQRNWRNNSNNLLYD